MRCSVRQINWRGNRWECQYVRRPLPYGPNR